MNEKLSEWIRNQLNERDWSQNRLAKEARLSSGTMSRLLNGDTRATPDMCKSIASAFDVPYKLVLEIAGIYPSSTFETEERQEWNGLIDGISPEGVREMIAVGRVLRAEKLKTLAGKKDDKR